MTTPMRRPPRRRRPGKPLVSNILIVAGAAVILSPLLGWAYSQYAQQRLGAGLAGPPAAAGEAMGTAGGAAQPNAPQAGNAAAGGPAGSAGAAAEGVVPEAGADSPTAGEELPAGDNPVFALPDDVPAQAFAPVEPAAPGDWPDPLTFDHTAGFPAMRIEIPKVGVLAMVVGDVRPRDLKQGPGHYPMTPYPGEMGNAAIAGHRTTYGAWFRNLHKLAAGDMIRVVYADATVTYAVEKVFVVPRTQWTVIAPTAYPALTLTTCDPPGSDRQRLAVRARLVEVVRSGT